jgi:sec-independent protein translocase protein TatB
MFGIGSVELLIIVLVALVILGPQKLPEVMRTMGKAMAEFKRVSTDVKRTLDTEVAAAESEQRDKDKKSKEAKRKQADVSDAGVDMAPPPPKPDPAAEAKAEPSETTEQSEPSAKPNKGGEPGEER